MLYRSDPTCLEARSSTVTNSIKNLLKKVWYIYTGYYSAIKRNAFESVLMRWMKSESCSVVYDSATPWIYNPWNSPGQNTEVGSLSLLQGNLPNPEIEPRSPALQADSLLASPRILEWVAFPFSRGSSQPRNQTGVSHTAGRFFTD